MVLNYKKVRDVKTPSRGTQYSSGIDFYVPSEFQEVILPPGHSIVIPSGIKVSIEVGYDLVFANRSGVASKKSLIMGAQVIDSDYQGEIFMNLINVGKDIVSIQPGEKICQAIVRKVELCDLVEQEELTWISDERGEGSRGSTDHK